MPEPYRLSRFSADGETLVLRGPYVVGRYEDDDRGLRNLVVVSLRDAGHSGQEVAECFGFSEEHVARLHARARREGSAGIVRQAGRPRKLTAKRAEQARAWSAEGVPNAEIARRLRLHRGTIGRLLGPRRAGKAEVQGLGLGLSADAGASGDEDLAEEGREPPGREQPDENGGAGQQEEAGKQEEAAAARQAAGGPALPACTEEGEVQSRYAGAMLLHPFISRLGAAGVLGALRRDGARRYDAASVVLAATFGFALGTSSLEGTKHLRVADAGALVGLQSFPHLRTLRPALKDLAKSCDPLQLQRCFAKAMLGSDDAPPELFYVDDHFVTYWGKRPVAKGYNIRRHLAEPGRDDTFVTDEHWRAICFASGEPRGLSVTLPEVVGQLREVIGGRPAMVGFDRGGSYPKVFSALKDAGMDWVTWRRAPLVAPMAEPRRAWVLRDGQRRYLSVADEEVTLEGYDGPVRQLSSIEDGKVVFQVLTSNTGFRAGPVVSKLRGRWSIENFNKYVEDHHGVHWLSSYDMEVSPDARLVANPARRAARASVAAAKTALAEAERELGRAVDASERAASMNARRDKLQMAKDTLAEAKAALKGVPAKAPHNELDPKAKRAKPVLPARALQMVCRLLAYNAELDLARRLNNYLDDPDEYRSVTRNLLHLGGSIVYERRRIVVTLERPSSPRVARALGELVAEVNSGPIVHLLGDRRPLTYQLAAP